MSCPRALLQSQPATALRVAAGTLAPAAVGRGTSKKITTIKTT